MHNSRCSEARCNALNENFSLWTSVMIAHVLGNPNSAFVFTASISLAYCFICILRLFTVLAKCLLVMKMPFFGVPVSPEWEAMCFCKSRAAKKQPHELQSIGTTIATFGPIHELSKACRN